MGDGRGRDSSRAWGRDPGSWRGRRPPGRLRPRGRALGAFYTRNGFAHESAVRFAHEKTFGFTRETAVRNRESLGPSGAGAPGRAGEDPARSGRGPSLGPGQSLGPSRQSRGSRAQAPPPGVSKGSKLFSRLDQAIAWTGWFRAGSADPRPAGGGGGARRSPGCGLRWTRVGLSSMGSLRCALFVFWQAAVVACRRGAALNFLGSCPAEQHRSVSCWACLASQYRPVPVESNLPRLCKWAGRDPVGAVAASAAGHFDWVSSTA